jgi:hypothetical protein
MIDADKYYVRHPDVAWRRVEEHALLVDPRDGRIFPLNPVAARIWELLDLKRRPSDIVEILVREFDAPPEVVRSDACSFLTRLVEERLAEECR